MSAPEARTRSRTPCARRASRRPSARRRGRAARRRAGPPRIAQRCARSAVWEIPANVDLFDRGISRGDVPRLWIDVIAHSKWAATNGNTASCRTRAMAAPCSRRADEIPEMMQAVTHYVARRLVEREHAFRRRRRSVTASRGSCWDTLHSAAACGPPHFCPGAVVATAALFVLAILRREPASDNQVRSLIPVALALGDFTDHRFRCADAARDQFAAHRARRTLDAVEIIGGRVPRHARPRRGRGHADRRNAAAVRAGEPVDHVQMVVAVDDEIGAVAGDDAENSAASVSSL